MCSMSSVCFFLPGISYAWIRVRNFSYLFGLLFYDAVFAFRNYSCPIHLAHCRRSQCEQDILKYIYIDMQTFPIHMWWMCFACAWISQANKRQAMMSYLDYEYYCGAYFPFSSLSRYDPYFIDEGVNHLETRKRNK